MIMSPVPKLIVALQLDRYRGLLSCFLSLVAGILLFSPFCHKAFAAEVYTGISAPMLKHMMENDKKVVVVHVLSGIEYEMHHISGSINIPINLLEGSAELPADKNTPIVFYCMGYR
jgi:Rhodanese-like domain